MQRQYPPQPPQTGQAQNSHHHGQHHQPVYPNNGANHNGHPNQTPMPQNINAFTQSYNHSASHHPPFTQIPPSTNFIQPQSRPQQFFDANRTQTMPIVPGQVNDQSWSQGLARRPPPPPHANSFPSVSPTSPTDHQRQAQQFQARQMPPQTHPLTGSYNGSHHNNNGQARSTLVSQNSVQASSPQQPPTPTSLQHTPDPLTFMRKQAADHAGLVLGPAREALENAYASVFSCVTADYARIKVSHETFKQKLAETERERNRLSAELAKVHKDIHSTTNSFAMLYNNAQRWKEELTKKEAELEVKTAECTKLNETIVALETSKSEISAKLLLMEKNAERPDAEVEQLKLAIQLELSKLYAPSFAELQRRRQENVVLLFRVKALEGELAKHTISEGQPEQGNSSSTQPAPEKPREIIDVDALDEELQKLHNVTEMGRKLFGDVDIRGKEKQESSESPVASTSKTTLDSLRRDRSEVPAAKEASLNIEKRTATPATIGPSNQTSSDMSSSGDERPLKRPRTALDDSTEPTRSPVTTPMVADVNQRPASRPPESPVIRSPSKANYVPPSPTVVEQEQSDDMVLVKPEPVDSFFDDPEEIPPAPSETTSPTSKTRRLTMIHLGLIYSQNSKGYTCRLCSLARKGGYRGPIAAYAPTASGDTLFTHCEVDHPEACEQIKSLSTADVMEKLARLSSS